VYILDTNIVSYFLRGAQGSSSLSQKILHTPAEKLFITVITLEEILCGALASIQKFRKKPEIIRAYAQFLELNQSLQVFQVLPYSQNAENVYRTFSAENKRAGIQDCRITAIAIATGFVVVTANVIDFRKIGGIQIEDWTL
jgi:tRNA(fMet)-specific endonuclease VapC